MGVVFRTTATFPLVLNMAYSASARRLEFALRHRAVCIQTPWRLNSGRRLELPMCVTPVRRNLAATPATNVYAQIAGPLGAQVCALAISRAQ